MSARLPWARWALLGALLISWVQVPAEAAVASARASSPPELIVQTGHSATVTALALSHDGQWLASAGEDHSVRIWDLSSGREVRALRDHPEPVIAVAWSGDDTLIASGGNDGKIRLWESVTGRLRTTLAAHQGFVTGLAFEPDGQTLLSSGTDKTLKLWTYRSGALVRTIALAEAADTLALSRDGRLLATGSIERLVRIWDTATWHELRSLPGGKGAVNAIAFSPDGRTLAFGSDDTVDEGGSTVHVFDATNGRSLRTLKAGTPYVFAINFSPDGRTLAAANEGAQVLLWEVAGGRSLRGLSGHSDAIKSLLYLPDGHLASGGFDGQIRIWDAATARTQRLLAGDTSPVNAIAVSDDGKLLASANEDRSISLWRLFETQQPQRLTGHGNVVTAVAFSPGGRTLASGSLDGDVRVWNTEDGRQISAFKAQRGDDNVALTLAFSPDGKTLATGSFDVDRLQLWDVATGRALRAIQVGGVGSNGGAGSTSGSSHAAGPQAFAFNADGRALAVASGDGSITIWDAALGQSLRRLQGMPVVTGSTKPSPYDSLSFSADGRMLASGRAAGIDLWDLNSGRDLRSLSRSVAPGANASPAFRHNAIWPQTFSRDGRLLAGGADDGAIAVWDTATGERLRTVAGHRGNVTSIRFVGDGSLLVSGGDDATLRLRDTTTGRELAQLVATGANEGLVVSPDGLFDGAPAAWEKILWRFSPTLRDVAPVEIFFNEFFYPNLLTELLQHKRPQAPRNLAQRDRRQPTMDLSLAEAAGNGDSRKVSVRVSVTDTGAGARDLRLFRNGSLVKAWRGDVLAGKKAVTLESSVTVVAGTNHLVAYAFNGDNVKSADGALVLQGSDRLRRRGVLYVLAVGVNQYANSAFDLSFAVADAQALAAELQRQQQRLTQFDRIEQKILLDRSATKEQLLASIATLAQTIQPEDAVVMFFAGHGLADDPRFYLIPHDLGYAGPRSPEALSARAADIFAHGISDEELERALEPVDAAQLLLIIDACNSGQVLETAEHRRGPMNSRGLAQLAYEKGMYILTAAQSYEEALETTQFGHGLLTYTLVEEGLKQGHADGHPADSQIEVREWFDYAVRRVPLIEARQRPRVFYRREPPATVLLLGRNDQGLKAR